MSLIAWIYRLGYPCAKLVWFFTRPETKGIIAVIRNYENILLIRHSYRTRNWCLVSGGINEYESPHDACIREIGEEVCLKAVWAGEFLSFPWTKEYKRDTVHAFVAYADGELIVDGDEVIEAQWFNINELPDNLDEVTAFTISAYRNKRQKLRRSQRSA